MTVIALTIMVLQGALMLLDELYFHRRRGLPRWERIGHPIDTASVLGCYVSTLWLEPTRQALVGYGLLAAFSCLLVTKDEFVHASRCDPAEQWLHAVLFVLHPLLLISAALLWLSGARSILLAQTIATAAFGAYQAIYWNLVAPNAGELRSAASVDTAAASPSTKDWRSHGFSSDAAGKQRLL